MSIENRNRVETAYPPSPDVNDGNFRRRHPQTIRAWVQLTPDEVKKTRDKCAQTTTNDFLALSLARDAKARASKELKQLESLLTDKAAQIRTWQTEIEEERRDVQDLAVDVYDHYPVNEGRPRRYFISRGFTIKSRLLEDREIDRDAIQPALPQTTVVAAPEYAQVVAAVVRKVLDDIHASPGDDFPATPDLCDLVRARGVDATNETIMGFVETETLLVGVVEYVAWRISQSPGPMTRKWFLEDMPHSEVRLDSTDHASDVLDTLVASGRLVEVDSLISIPTVDDDADDSTSAMGAKVVEYLNGKDLSFKSIVGRFKKDGISVDKALLRSALDGLVTIGDLTRSDEKTPKYGLIV